MGKKLHFMLSGPELHDEKPHAASHGLGGDDELSISGTQIAGGIIATARLGSGTADSTSFYRGNSTWVTRTVHKGAWPVMQSGRWYDSASCFDYGVAGAGHAGNIIACSPILIPQATTFNQIGIVVTSAVGGSTCRLGIYAPNHQGRPGTLVTQVGPLSTAVTGDVTAAINVTLNGFFWLAYISSTTISVHVLSPTRQRYSGASAIATTTKQTYGAVARTYGALPTTAPTLSLGGFTPKVGLRVA